ncbi:17113_t:CDS:1, partial [Cetraspora pellucida]
TIAKHYVVKYSTSEVFDKQIKIIKLGSNKLKEFIIIAVKFHYIL